jgi:hypothetical protein
MSREKDATMAITTLFRTHIVYDRTREESPNWIIGRTDGRTDMHTQVFNGTLNKHNPTKLMVTGEKAN